MSDAPALEGRAMALYKAALASGDPSEFVAFLEACRGGAPGALTVIERLLKAERMRLLKLKSLGATADFQAKAALTDALIDQIEASTRRGSR